MYKCKPAYVINNKQLETSTGHVISIEKACEVTKKPKQTILRWNREGWPQAYFELISLYAEGRVKPPDWKHCFFNHNNQLEIYSVGEISEQDILNIDYLRQINHSLQTELKREISELDSQLEDVKSENDGLHQIIDEHLPGALAANDRKFATEI